MKRLDAAEEARPWALRRRPRLRTGIEPIRSHPPRAPPFAGRGKSSHLQLRFGLLGEVEVRIEHPDFGNAVDRKTVAVGRLADRVLRRTVIDAESLLAVRRDIRVNSCHLLLGVVVDDSAAGDRSFAINRNRKSVRESPLDQITWH